MDWTQVNSLHLSHVAYDDTDQVLGIRFQDGSEYQYHNVPMQLIEQLMRSGSKGRFFREQIKGKFEFERIT